MILPITVVILLLGLVGLAILWTGLPDPADLPARAGGESSRIYDRNGRLLYEVPLPETGRRTRLPLSAIAPVLIKATIATEDASFYNNPGIDPLALLRAVWQTLRGEESSGGSTITQQLARLTLMSAEERGQRTLWRKLREMLLALRLTQRYSKDEILTFYLNEIFYGNLSYGVEAAAQGYFGKSARDLDLAEASLLAGLPQSPSRYNPLTHLTAARARQQVVLNLMVKQGLITASQAALAAQEPLQFAGPGLAGQPIPPAAAFATAPHFIAHILDELTSTCGLDTVQRGGLIVTTTLDSHLQAIAETAIRRHLQELQDHNARSAAAIVLDAATGEVLAMVGSPDYFDAAQSGAVNVALAPRQPGSALKPFAYAAAFTPPPATTGEGVKAWTPATVVADIRRVYLTRPVGGDRLANPEPYVPYNYDGQFHGPVSLRTALANSYNVPAIVVLDHVGVPAMLDLLHAAGITTLRQPADHYGLSLVLGGGEVTLLDLTAAYAIFATGGLRRTPVTIRAISGSQYRSPHPPICQPPVPDQPTSQFANDLTDQRVLSPEVAYLITDILADNDARAPSFGPYSPLRLDRPAAAKTGTTGDFRDNWTVGYTPISPSSGRSGLIVGVWVGNPDNEPMRQVSGISGAAPIWHDIMVEALQGQPAIPFARPASLLQAEVCALSGLLPTPDCPLRRSEWFIPGTVPTEPDTWYRRVTMDRRTGRPADVNTPPDDRVERLIVVYPPELAEWAREQGIPAGEEAVTGGEGQPVVQVISPDPEATYLLSPNLPRELQRLSVRAMVSRDIAWVELRVDDVPLARLATPPYQAFWVLQPGEHRFTAVAQDRSGQEWVSRPVRIRVRPAGG